MTHIKYEPKEAHVHAHQHMLLGRRYIAARAICIADTAQAVALLLHFCHPKLLLQLSHALLTHLLLRLLLLVLVLLLLDSKNKCRQFVL
jgi:hypothetical protein